MHARSNKLALIAITAALASPFAIAQSATAQEMTASPTPTETTASPAQPATQAQADMAATTPAPAAPVATAQRKPWSAIDTDGDGKISALEAQSDEAFLKHFPTMDTDKDGFVTIAEYKAHVAAKSTKKAGSQG